MIKDFLISFKDNFRERVTNPFLGTYLLVWIIRNWELVYGIFTFDKSAKQIDKISFIKEYFKAHNFLENLGWNIFWAFGVLALTYILLNVSRLIINFSEKTVAPWIYKISDKSSVVLKSFYLQLKEHSNELEVELDKERDKRHRLESRIKTLEIENSDLLKKNDPDEVTFTENKPELSLEDRLINRLSSKGILDEFRKMAIQIGEGKSISKNNVFIPNFIELGLIKFVENSAGGSFSFFELTDDGVKLLRRLGFLEDQRDSSIIPQ